MNHVIIWASRSILVQLLMGALGVSAIHAQASGSGAASQGGDAMTLAESNPDAFMDMLRKRALDDLLAEREKASYQSITKYRAFASRIQNETTRTRAQDFLNDLERNYRAAWHLMYPIPLSPRWHEIKGNPVARKDFAEALRMADVTPCDQDGVIKAMQPVEGLKLFGPVNYMDPLQDALKKLSDDKSLPYRFKSTKVTSFNRVESTGFPLDTFKYASFDVRASGDVEAKDTPVNRVFIMIDQYSRVIAYQEVIESPKERRLYSHTNTRSVYNFLQMRRKGQTNYKIAYSAYDGVVGQGVLFLAPSSVRGSGDVCTLISELIDDEWKPREWVKLYLPRHLAECCLFICKQVED